MDIDPSGCGTGIGLLLVLALVGGLVFGGAWLITNVNSAVQDARVSLAREETYRQQAAADAAQARADAEKARQDARIALEEEDSEQQREANIHRETMYQMWTVALAHYADDNPVMLSIIAGLLGLVVGAGGLYAYAIAANEHDRRRSRR